MLDKIKAVLKDNGCQGDIVILDVKLNTDTFQPTLLVQTNIRLYSIDLLLGDTVTIIEDLPKKEIE
jgi:hypothetical protein